ncbi:MAG: CDP-diacylglycerol--serine O-phosphatidyltransferase [Candidatus Rokubacteria bacterium]|nr:CDP-diacylglycerol--serine O-phosphatidyltransferase [Candidatus Rokubacteria bacterium]
MRRRFIGGEGPRTPRRRRWQTLREKRRRGIFLLPSLLTTANLFSGFLAVLFTMNERYPEAALAIFAAIFLDILDGKVARLTNTTTQFGLEFDSLADQVSFCVAPAVLLYAWALSQLGRAAWLASFLFVICGALRLARFNVYSGLIDRRFFVGLPTPAAAGLAAATVLLFADGELPRWGLLAIGAATYLVALLMVSTFRYWSFKEVDFARRHPLGVLLVVVLGVLIVATAPQVFLFTLLGLYALSGPARRLWVRKPESAGTTDTEPTDSH